MKNNSAFCACHPAVGLVYFLLVLGFSMFFMHPAYLAASFFCALYCNILYGKKRGGLMLLLPLMALAMLANPAFSHEGATILLYLPWGNPLTLESIAYGAATAFMLGAVLLWFGCFNAVMTADKFTYLFGRIAPALSLVLTMTMAFVPRFSSRMREVYQARRAVYPEKKRLVAAVSALSAMVTWSLDSAIQTADSMKSRGYGLVGRTAYSIYRFDSRDKAVLLWLASCGFYIVSGAVYGGMDWRYYPTIAGGDINVFSVSFWLTYIALCLTPAIIDYSEVRKWKSSKLKI